MRRRSTCPISSALDVFGDKWSLLVMRDVLFRQKAHYREFLRSEEGIATNILADRLDLLEQAGLIRRVRAAGLGERSPIEATDKGKDLIPFLLEMMVWSAKHLPGTTVPDELLAQLRKDRDKAARAIRRKGGIEPFLRGL